MHERQEIVQEKVVSVLLTLTAQFQPFLWNSLSSQKSQPKKKKYALSDGIPRLSQI